MTPLYSPRFIRQFDNLPLEIQQKTRKQVEFLLRDIRHPSLRAKKYDEADDIWQARVDDHYRFYFRIDGDMYTLTSVRKHRD
mgnify:CR=1 FL=1